MARGDGLPTPENLETLYRFMLREMGPTGWWPADGPYEIMVGAVLIQNVSWRNADRSLDALKAAGLLDPHAIAQLDDSRLQELIRPSGFYRNKSRALREMSRWYVERCDARPEGAAGIDDDALRKELLALFGIGGETADDLLLYVFDRRAFIADTYARRLFAFLGYRVPAGYAAFHKAVNPIALATSLTVADLKEFHGLIDEYGKTYRDDAAKAESFLGRMEWE
ncbi:endonuclease III domain-containing protein [Bifidobacterium jacchi]|uniref:DNA lyase n=1 Tax=Bifidobacterium jacchi TaxID=2490545 RepID=A0A5N5RGJ5_9BIFI|nr:DNA lyase [Bifidobacterium jacchi]KAB5606387.1 DNA lyase [Bifidobacterium jacchi]